jgi:hypothetical protein
MVDDTREINDFQDVLYFYVFGEKMGKKMLKPLLREKRHRNQVITGIADLTIYLANKTTHRRFKPVCDDLNDRIMGTGELFLAETEHDFRKRLEGYRKYLNNVVKSTLEEMEKAYR